MTSSLFVGLAAFFTVLAVSCTYIAGHLKNKEDSYSKELLSNKITEISKLEQEKGKLQSKLTALIENDLKPHIIYAAVEYDKQNLKVIFNNTGDRILRNPSIKYKLHTRAHLNGKMISNQEYKNGYIDFNMYEKIKLGWKSGENWEVNFPVRINENIPSYETIMFTFSFSMTVSGFKAGATDEHSNFSRMFVFINQLNPEKNFIKNEHSILNFHRVE